MEVIKRAAVHTLQVELPTVSVMTSNPDPSVVEECWKANLHTAMGEDARSLDLKVARILPEVVAARWEVHQLREILPMTSRVPSYSENPVIQQRSRHV
jgi:hypothetical protein